MAQWKDWKETLLGCLLVAAVAGFCYNGQQREKIVGAFSIKPGGSDTLEEHLIGSNLLPDNEGKEFRDVSPVRIDTSPYITCVLLSSYSGGYYLNFAWSERSDFKYRISAAPDTPRGKYSVTIVFPSGYIHTIAFSVSE